ncbi:MAG: 2Fe-2S iron-sulfur cluster binding domain-containing protein [Bdellovibrio sp.]|nr:2Fe-2S iron-sulfur cluster binding domain-containing protein [Bdellovibrio sp.]
MKIKFLPQNIEVEGTPDKSLLQIATENQLEIRSICKGVPSCAECRVRISEGDNNVLPPGKAELSLIGTNYFIDGRRLSCQVRCFGDVTVDLTEQVERAENQTKKIRGFRTNKQVESKAVNDTMLLDEKVDEMQQAQQPQQKEAKASGEGQPQQQQRQQPRPPQQQQQQRNQQGQHKQKQQGKPKQGGGQQHQQKAQGQQQGQKQHNRPQHNQPKQQKTQQQQQQKPSQQNDQKKQN